MAVVCRKWHELSDSIRIFHLGVAERKFSQCVLIDVFKRKAGGLLRTGTRPTLNLLLLLCASFVSMNIHTRGQS